MSDLILALVCPGLLEDLDQSNHLYIYIVSDLILALVCVSGIIIVSDLILALVCVSGIICVSGLFTIVVIKAKIGFAPRNQFLLE